MGDKGLRILLTNDDGVKTKSTLKLGELLRAEGHEVDVVIPKENQSGISGALSFRKKLYVQEEGKGVLSVTGTPCDCINLVNSGELGESTYDLVISGINEGENTGLTVYDSGTVAAARRAKAFGYKSIAVSYAGYACSQEEMDICNVYLIDLLKRNNYFQEQDERFTNINIPIIQESHKLEGFKEKEGYVGKVKYGQKFKKYEGYYEYDNQDCIEKGKATNGCDYGIIELGKVSIVNISLDTK